MNVLVFVSSSCPHCPHAEEVAKEIVPNYYAFGANLEKVRIKTSEGKELSRKYNVMGVPTIILTNDDGKEIERMVGAPNEDRLKKSIEKALGIRKSFFSKILNLGKNK